ncbi:MAG: hypothetical protein J7L15_02250 [Clostridiales bacterium]|nr:hypothetical protein [Clostridiales bacterium]
MFIVLFTITAIGLIMMTANELLSNSRIVQSINEIKESMKLLDSNIQETYYEGNGSVRKININFHDAYYTVHSNDDTIEAKVSGPTVLEYFSRRIEGNLITISGGDVDCYRDGNYLIMKNSFLKLNFTSFGSVSDQTLVDTSKILNSIEFEGEAIDFVNTSIMINDDGSTSVGNGYVDLLETGNSRPFCTVEAFVNSSTPYRVKYTLFSGTDFIFINIISDGLNVSERFDFKNKTGFSVKGSSKYLSYVSSSKVFSILLDGSNLLSLDNSTYISNGYLINSFLLKQDIEGNGLLLIFTNSSYTEFENKVKCMRYDKIPQTRFGKIFFSVPNEANFYIVLLYDNIDLENSLRWKGGSHDIIIMNDDERIKLKIS